MEHRLVGVNSRGYRVGQDHHHAVLTDYEVDLIRQLREVNGWKYEAIAQKFEISKTLVAKICRYEARAQTAVRWRKAQSDNLVR